MKVAKKALPKGVSQEFLDTLNNKSSEELKAMIVTLQLQNEENEQFKAGLAYEQAKQEFDYAKDKFDLVAGPVKEVTVSIRNRTKVVIERLKEKGIV